MNPEDERRLQAIGCQLRQDPALNRVLHAPTAREKRLLSLRGLFFPTGYLLTVAVYALFVCGPAVFPVLAVSVALIFVTAAMLVALADF